MQGRAGKQGYSGGPGVLYVSGQGRAGPPAPHLSPYPPALPVSQPGCTSRGLLPFVCPD